MQRVEVKNPNEGWLGTKYIVEGKEVRNVKSVDFHVGVKELPEFTFNTNGIPDIDVVADVTINPSPTNLREACRIIANELQKHGDFYGAFVESVASVLKSRERYVGDGCFCIDIDDGMDYKGLADEIVKRISGEE